MVYGKTPNFLHWNVGLSICNHSSLNKENIEVRNNYRCVGPYGTEHPKSKSFHSHYSGWSCNHVWLWVSYYWYNQRYNNKWPYELHVQSYPFEEKMRKLKDDKWKREKRHTSE